MKRRYINMNIVKKPNGNELTIALEGRLDTTTSPQLENELRTALNGVSEFILDLGQPGLHFFRRSACAALRAEGNE
jgi:anti-anti-sigma regulatory factor